MPRALEVGHHRLAFLGHQPRVGFGIAHLDAGHQAQVREPRRSAEGRRLDQRRDHVAAGGVNGLVEIGAGRGELRRHVGALEGDRSVRLDEDQEHVRLFHQRQVGVHRRTGRERVRRAQRPGDQTGLAGVGLDHRRREDRLGLEMPAELLGHEQADHHHPGHEDRRTLLRVERGGRDAAKRPSKHDIEKREHGGHRRDDADDQPERRRPGDHRGDVRHVADVPVQVDVAPVERRRGDVGVVAEHQDEPARGQPGDRGGREGAEPQLRGDDHDQQDTAFDRELAGPADHRRRPDILEGERDVEQRHRGGQRQAAPGHVVRCCHSHTVSIRNDPVSAASAAAASSVLIGG